MNFLSLFVLIPILMLGGLFLSRNMKQIRWVAATGASLLLVLSVVLTFLFLGERAAGNDAEMLFMAEMPWFTPLNINYSVGVDGISVAMLLLSSVIVFTGVCVVEDRSAAQRVFLVVLPALDGGLRLFHFDRPLHDVPLL